VVGLGELLTRSRNSVLPEVVNVARKETGLPAADVPDTETGREEDESTISPRAGSATMAMRVSRATRAAGTRPVRRRNIGRSPRNVSFAASTARSPRRGVMRRNESRRRPT
jgi:hypothetical protein